MNVILMLVIKRLSGARQFSNNVQLELAQGWEITAMEIQGM